MTRTSTLFILLTAAAACQQLSAQPVLTAATSLPALERQENHKINSVFPVPVLATSGSGNSWDAGNAVWGGGVVFCWYQAPSASPNAASYPSMTLTAQAISNTFPNTWWHFETSSSEALFLGEGSTPNPQAELLCEFPLALGDDFSSTYQEPGGSPVTFTAQYVASGEVVAPWGTMTDVVMFAIDNGPTHVLYKADNLLFPIGKYVEGVSFQIDEVEIFSSVNGPEVGRIGVWPVPATGAVQLALPGSGSTLLLIRDASGRIVLQERTGYALHTLDLTGLSPGPYLVEALLPHGERSVGRLVVE